MLRVECAPHSVAEMQSISEAIAHVAHVFSSNPERLPLGEAAQPHLDPHLVCPGLTQAGFFTSEAHHLRYFINCWQRAPYCIEAQDFTKIKPVISGHDMGEDPSGPSLRYDFMATFDPAYEVFWSLMQMEHSILSLGLLQAMLEQRAEASIQADKLRFRHTGWSEPDLLASYARLNGLFGGDTGHRLAVAQDLSSLPGLMVGVFTNMAEKAYEPLLDQAQEPSVAKVAQKTAMPSL